MESPSIRQLIVEVLSVETLYSLMDLKVERLVYMESQNEMPLKERDEYLSNNIIDLALESLKLDICAIKMAIDSCATADFQVPSGTIH